MKNLLAKFRGSMPGITLKYILGSRYFPFFTAAVVLALSYLALDIVTIYYLAIVVILMLALLDDLTPLLVHFAFFNVMMSATNSPSSLTANDGPMDYFSRPEIIALIAVIAVFVVVAIVARFALIVRQRSFRPNGVFWGLCFLSVAFLLNGAGAAGYTLLNLGYGVAMVFAFLGVFVLFSANMKVNEGTFVTVGFGFMALSVFLLVELFVRYMQILPQFGQFMAGEMEYNRFKELIYFGWGNWNTAGMLFSICIPAIFLLARRYQHGWILVLYATLIAVCGVLTWSRQALIGVAVAYPASAIAVMVKGKNRPLHIATVCAVVLVFGVAAFSRLDLIKSLIGGMSDSIVGDDGSYDGNGRLDLIYAALDYFVKNPFFGSGFFVDFESHGATDFAQISLVPMMAHNTFAEMIGVSGLLGIVAYCVHRVQTVISFAKKPSVDKLFTGLIILSLLAMCMFDNHIFYILPTFLYSGLLVMTCEG